MIIPVGMQRVVLHPGDHYSTRETVLISTILGSCVAACMYDPVARVAGMNHFLLANRRYARNMPMSITEAGRYGVHAMELLINDLLNLGAKRQNLRVKIFGGGTVIENLAQNNFSCVGEVNKRFITEFLETEKISIEASDLGGNRGRIIRFRTDTYNVYRKYILNTATEKVETKEYRYWEHQLKVHEAEGGTVVLFTDKDKK